MKSGESTPTWPGKRLKISGRKYKRHPSEFAVSNNTRVDWFACMLYTQHSTDSDATFQPLLTKIQTHIQHKMNQVRSLLCRQNNIERGNHKPTEGQNPYRCGAKGLYGRRNEHAGRRLQQRLCVMVVGHVKCSLGSNILFITAQGRVIYSKHSVMFIWYTGTQQIKTNDHPQQTCSRAIGNVRVGRYVLWSVGKHVLGQVHPPNRFSKTAKNAIVGLWSTRICKKGNTSTQHVHPYILVQLSYMSTVSALNNKRKTPSCEKQKEACGTISKSKANPLKSRPPTYLLSVLWKQQFSGVWHNSTFVVRQLSVFLR